ncbi:hypothetical protein [Geodermatophilus ruber]|uniref:Uncharacterized protein n=1 Tax=Geodermatophilus ruber TaxID=504800 RepID=A0A1I4JNX8_9ACTN|nr:hypothetical protein [Geodermatophilus ruber]SFL67836.1 hypothetical protein SAMN04488085_11565 [Geodermatophilus ruber]
MGTDELRCALCGRTGTAADAASGWSLSVPPRATGAQDGGRPRPDRVTALCAECARRSVRDLEARLDP